MNIEVLGTLASVLVLISFMMKGETKIRIINIVGAITFVIYGVLIGAFSVWMLNGILCLVHVYKLIKGKKHDIMKVQMASGLQEKQFIENTQLKIIEHLQDD